jgi:hypothetical protein
MTTYCFHIHRGLLAFRKRHYLVMEQLDVKQTSDTNNISNSEKESLLRTSGLPPPNYSTNTALSVNNNNYY